MTRADPLSYIRNPGPKATVRGARAACSSDNAIVTETILRVMADGGNAADAAIAGCMVQAAIQPFMTNHAGTVSFLYYEAATGLVHQLHSAGTFPPHLAPFKPIPKMKSGFGRLPPSACIPGFMPAMKAIYRRFGTRPWASLCEDAVYWAQDGHPVSSFEYGVNLSEQDFTTYFPEGRRFYMPNGYWPRVGERFASADLAATLRRVRDHGPDDMIDGEWADKFVAKARDMGWAITLADMSANPPRWIEPMRVKHHEFEIISLSQPEQQGVFIAMVLGILSHLDIRAMTPQSADHLFAMSHALRLALYFCGFLGDPTVAPYGADVLIDPAFHKSLARLIEGLKPRVDLSRHLALTGGPGNRGDEHGLAGLPSAGDVRPLQPPGSCELSIVDKQGNWVQMMNTLQSGGIPGMVVGGVAMIGSHATFAGITGHFDIKLVEGARLRTIVGNTLVLSQGQPVMGLGTPGNVFCTMPQVLTNLLDFGMEPYAAIDAPRHLHLGEDNCLIIEDRLDPTTLSGLAALGVGVSVMPAYDWHMGSFQMCYRDGASGDLCATVDPRRCGEAGGLF